MRRRDFDGCYVITLAESACRSALKCMRNQQRTAGNRITHGRGEQASLTRTSGLESGKLPPMRKLLALFLLVVLPLSWTASAVAAYCKHETTAAGQNHMGHHDHQHDADGGVGANTPADPVQSGGSDPDCGVCHAGGVYAPTGAINLYWIATASAAFADCRDISARLLFERPERPQWRVLA